MSTNVFLFLDSAFEAVASFLDGDILSTSADVKTTLDNLLVDAVDAVDDAISDINQVVSDGAGTVTIDGTSLSGQLTVDGAPRPFTLDLSDDLDTLVADINNGLSDSTGSASLSDGQFTGDITIGSDQYALNFDVAEALKTNLVNVLSSIATPLPFTNGTVAVDVDTALGDIDGTINFSGGDLDFDLVTPFGDVKTSIDFPENAQFDVPLNLGGLSPLNLEVDLAAGVVSVPIFGGFDVALETLSGDLSFSNSGFATLALDLGLSAPIETTFEIGPLADVVATELVEDFSGDLTIDEGFIDGTIVSRFGEFPITASLDDLVLQASAVIDETSGTLTLNDGVIDLDLNTPLGDLAGGLAFSSADTLATVTNLLA